MLEGKNVSLRIVEKQDLPILLEWDNNVDFRGQFENLKQETMADLERLYDNIKDAQWFFIEKAGFKREGILRRTFYCRGKWRDDCIYSIIREEWKEPQILPKTA